MIFCKIKLTFKRLHWQGETKISYQVASLKKKNLVLFTTWITTLSQVSAINKTSVPEPHRDVCHQLMEMCCLFFGDLDHKASLDSDYGDVSNLATNELLIFLCDFCPEILQWCWGMSTLNVHAELCSSLCLPLHPPHSQFSSLRINRQPLMSWVRPRIFQPLYHLLHYFSMFPFLRVWVSDTSDKRLTPKIH